MIQFLYTNRFDGVTVSASSEASASNYPATNVQHVFLKKTWRSTGLSNEWLKFDLGSAKQVTLFTFFQNNLTSSATVKLYGHASDLGSTEAAWASASYSATISNFNSRVGVLSLSQTYRYWMLSFSDATNTDGYIEVGRVYGGVATSPTENFNESFTESIIDNSEIRWTVGQTAYSTQRERTSEFSIQFQDIKTANQTVLRNLFASVYKTTPFVMALDLTSEPLNLTRYGLLTSDLQFQGSVNNRASVSLTFKELR